MKKFAKSNKLKAPAWREHLFLILLSLVFIWPLLMVISISFTDEATLASDGYRLIPSLLSTKAYEIVFTNPQKIIDAYYVTILTALVGTFLAVLVQALLAFPISRSNYILRKPLTFFIFFTMLFGGGLIPTYILNTQYLGLGNTLWIYILPALVSAWNIIIIRTFFQGLPSSIVESAKVDGAGEFIIFFRIILPISKPVLATISLLTLLGKWNDWYTSLIYISDTHLYTLQYLLQRILREIDFLRGMSANMPGGFDNDMIRNLPIESVRFALVVIAAGPMLFIFPFFQKYFTRGLTVGSVKG